MGVALASHRKLTNSPPTGRLRERQIKLTGMALMFISLSLVGFFMITLSKSLLSTLSGISVGYPEYVRLTNSVLAAICAAFLLWPREGSRLVGRWNDYVGLAFAIFAVFYGLRFVALLIGRQFPAYTDQIDFVTDVVVYLGSCLNNLLLLAAARILLNKFRPIPEEQKVAAGGGVWSGLVREWRAFRAALPGWYWVMFPISLVALLEHMYPQLVWVRFPDALFSVYCLSWFAYALWLSFRVRRQVKPPEDDRVNSVSRLRFGLRVRHQMIVAWLSFLLILAYAAGQVVFAANPFIAYSVSESSAPESPPATWVREYLKLKVSEDIKKIATRLHAKNQKRMDENASAPPPVGEPTAKENFAAALTFFDGAIFAILFPMKSLLFLPAFVLYLMSLISTNSFRVALRETTSRRQDYLSEEGILNVIGASLAADEVRVIIRLPGIIRRQEVREERVFAIVWGAPGASPVKRGPKIYPLSESLLLVRAMKTEGKEIVVNNEDEGEVAARLRETGPFPQTLALAPIRFHGGVIGAIQVIFRGYGKYNNGTLEQLKFMAELIAPSVQDFRTVSAADKLGSRLSRGLTGRAATDAPQGHWSTDGFKAAAEKMVEALYDLLNPLGVGLMLECGFTHVTPVYPKEGEYHDVLVSPVVDYYETLKRPEAALPLVQTSEGTVRIEHDPLFVRTESGRPYEFGSLTLIIPHEKDKFAKPTLAGYYLTRRMMASLIANGIFNAARNSLNAVIQDLSVSLNKENLSAAEWFDRVEAAAKAAGFRWVVAAEKDGEPDKGPREYVASLSVPERENLMGKPLCCIPHHVPEAGTRHILHLQFKETGHRLWLGVERAEFGDELNFQSPWRVFLEELEDVAGTALVYIEEHRRAEMLRSEEEARTLKELEDEWQKSTADFSAMLMHQLVNMADNLRASAADLLESINGGPPASDADDLVSITHMKENAEMMMEMTSAYNKATEMGTPSACRVEEAAQQTRKLFQFALRKKEIALEIETPPDLWVRAPTPVITLALAALTYNAIDAIQSRGAIRIEAEANGVVVHCRVKNTGPPVSVPIPELFRPGAKGKHEHSGRGLYFISRSLSNYGGGIELSYTGAGETCFTLCLPSLVK